MLIIHSPGKQRSRRKESVISRVRIDSMMVELIVWDLEVESVRTLDGSSFSDDVYGSQGNETSGRGPSP